MPWPLKILIGLAIAYVVLKVGFWMLRGLANPLPPPPPAGEMRRVNLRYRCDVCGVELKMTAAPDQDPPAPRHCTEEMELLAPIDDL
jgi:hypothetical protein